MNSSDVFAAKENAPASGRVHGKGEQAASSEQLLKLKKKLRMWERDFQTKNGRMPAKDDIDACPDMGLFHEMLTKAVCYKQYQKLKKAGKRPSPPKIAFMSPAQARALFSPSSSKKRPRTTSLNDETIEATPEMTRKRGLFDLSATPSKTSSIGRDPPSASPLIKTRVKTPIKAAANFIDRLRRVLKPAEEVADTRTFGSAFDKVRPSEMRLLDPSDLPTNDDADEAIRDLKWIARSEPALVTNAKPAPSKTARTGTGSIIAKNAFMSPKARAGQGLFGASQSMAAPASDRKRRALLFSPDAKVSSPMQLDDASEKDPDSPVKQPDIEPEELLVHSDDEPFEEDVLHEV